METTYLYHRYLGLFFHTLNIPKKECFPLRSPSSNSLQNQKFRKHGTQVYDWPKFSKEFMEKSTKVFEDFFHEIRPLFKKDSVLDTLTFDHLKSTVYKVQINVANSIGLQNVAGHLLQCSRYFKIEK